MILSSLERPRPGSFSLDFSPKTPLLSIVLLSWNRIELLRTTLLSLIANTKVPYEIFIVDNNSNKTCQHWINLMAERHNNVHAILLDKNIGGEAINLGLERVQGDFVLISENDLEYLPNWDIRMLSTMEKCPELGQLSPFSPEPMKEFGETWTIKPYERLFIQDSVLKIATENVGTSSLVRMSVFEKGVRFSNIADKTGDVLLPADAKFSADIKALGYLAAWSEEYEALNWGHIQTTWHASRTYYADNWAAKSASGVDGLKTYKDFLLRFDNATESERAELAKSQVGELLQKLELERHRPLRPGIFSVQTTLFVSENGEFNSDSVTFSRANPYEAEFNIAFDLSEFDNIQALRWDPYEGKACEVNITGIELIDKSEQATHLDLAHVVHNGKTIKSSNRVVFDTTDPNFIFPAHGSFKKCIISGRWKLSQLEHQSYSSLHRVGKLSAGTYVCYFENIKNLDSVEFFSGEPIDSNQVKNLRVTICQVNDWHLIVMFRFEQDEEDLWIQRKVHNLEGFLATFSFQRIKLIEIVWFRLRRTRFMRRLQRHWSKNTYNHEMEHLYSIPLASPLTSLNDALKKQGTNSAP